MVRRSPTDPNVSQLELLFDDPIQAARHLFDHHGSDRELFDLVTAATACIREQCNEPKPLPTHSSVA